MGSGVGLRPNACVLGDIDIVRPLGLAGVSCSVVPRPRGIARYSRYARDVLLWVDPWERPGELLQVLLSWARTQLVPPVLYFEEDGDLLFASRHREQLSPAFRFVLGDADLIETLVDKERFQQLAATLDLPVPRARTVVPSKDSPDDVDLEFPVVIKARTRRHEQWGRLAGLAKALRVETPEQMKSLWPQLVRLHLDRLVVQELVPGPETAMETYHSFTDDAGEILGEFTGRKIRTYPRQQGVSTAVTTTDAPDLVRLGREVIERTGLRGVAKLDCKRGPDGRLHLIEINPRFSLWHHPGAFAGVNIPELVYRELAGLPRRKRTRARPGVSWCWMGLDRKAARAAGIPFAEWARWALSCEAKYLSWRDPLPFVRGLSVGR
jgi:predicted ATP-grasp superfamily ATP-dependent carboligase